MSPAPRRQGIAIATRVRLAHALALAAECHGEREEIVREGRGLRLCAGESTMIYFPVEVS